MESNIPLWPCIYLYPTQLYNHLRYAVFKSQQINMLPKLKKLNSKFEICFQAYKWNCHQSMSIPSRRQRKFNPYFVLISIWKELNEVSLILNGTYDRWDLITSQKFPLVPIVKATILQVIKANWKLLGFFIKRFLHSKR